MGLTEEGRSKGPEVTVGTALFTNRRRKVKKAGGYYATVEGGEVVSLPADTIVSPLFPFSMIGDRKGAYTLRFRKRRLGIAEGSLGVGKYRGAGVVHQQIAQGAKIGRYPETQVTRAFLAGRVGLLIRYPR